MNDEYLHEYFKYLEYLGHDNDAFYANNNNNKKKKQYSISKCLNEK